MSIRISLIMKRTADAVAAGWEAMDDQQISELRQLVIDHLPPVLVETAGERLWTDLPPAYLAWMMAKSLAARIVYREGFEYLETMEDDDLDDIALRYLDLEQERSTLANAVLDSPMEDRARIAALLRSAGIFSTMGRREQP
jgi:uncharacterized protein YjiS (DUF1127 family)